MAISSQKQSLLRSCKTLWLKRLENIVQDIGMLPLAVNAMRDGVSLFFDNVCNEAQGLPVKEESFMTTSNILLVNEDDLEVGIRLDNLGNRIQETAGSYLVEVRRRFMSLFDNMDVSARVNPVDTEGLSRGLKAMLGELGSSSVDEKMLIIDKIEKKFINTISSVYREVDKLLQDAGISSANVVLTNTATTVKKTNSPWGTSLALKNKLDAIAQDDKVDEAATMSLIDGGFILPDLDDSSSSSSAFNFDDERDDNNPFNKANPALEPVFKPKEKAQSQIENESPLKEKVPTNPSAFSDAHGVQQTEQNAPASNHIPEQKTPGKEIHFEKKSALTVENPPAFSQKTPETPKNSQTSKTPETPQNVQAAPLAPMMEMMPEPLAQTSSQPSAPTFQPKTQAPPVFQDITLPPQNSTPNWVQNQAPVVQKKNPIPKAKPVAPIQIMDAPSKTIVRTDNPLADLWNFLRRDDVPSPDEVTLRIVRERIYKRLQYLHEGLDFDDETTSLTQIQANSDIYNLHQLFPDLFASENDNVEPELPNGLDSRAVGLTPGSVEAASLDAIDLIISALTRNPELPEPFKSFLLLVHPQLSLFALNDPSVFTDSKHPFHICAQTLGALILGLPPDTPDNHPVFDKLFESLRTPLRKLQKPFSPKILESVISKIQENLLARMIVREENLAVAAQEHFPLLNLLEKREKVLSNIADSISTHLLPNLPDVLRDFFEGPWQQRMQKMWLEKDNDKSRWHEEFRLLNLLQQSFLPIQNDEERQTLGAQIPHILQTMRQIMTECGLNDVQQKVILSVCVNLQNSALKGRDGLLNFKKQTNLPDLRLRAELRMRRVHSGTKRLNTLYYTGKNNTKVPLPADFVPGVWLEFHVDRDTPCLARLCDVNDLHHWFFLANPDTQQFWALQPDVLEHQFAENRAKIVIPPSPFEAAAKQVLNQNS